MFISHRYPLVIRENHLDTFGHVNNATYLQIMEEARWEWITAGGFGWKEIQVRGLGPTILEIAIQFRKELHLRERIEVVSTVSNYSGKVGELKQEITKSDGSIATVAIMKIGLFNLVTRKLIEPTDEWLAAIGLETPPAL
jgi:thioesterase III